LRQRLEQVGALPEAAFQALRAELVARRFDMGAYHLRAGEQAHWCFFVETGLVRELYVDDQGSEHIRSLVADGQLTGSLLDLLSGAPSVTWTEEGKPQQRGAQAVGRYAVRHREEHGRPPPCRPLTLKPAADIVNPPV
jgi:CRP-like cAMP-binding protein